MRLRTKLTLLPAMLVTGGFVLLSGTVYVNARRSLEKSAERLLHQQAEHLISETEQRYQDELRKMTNWSAMPLVVATALDDRNEALVNAFEAYFDPVRKREDYSAIFLMNLEGDCVACSNRIRLRHSYCREVVSKTSTARAAMRGESSISEIVLSMASGRPTCPITVPVWHENRVVGVLRGTFSPELLSDAITNQMRIGHKGRAWGFCPGLDMKLPEGHVLHDPLSQAAYIPPELPIPAVPLATRHAIFRYVDDNGAHLAAVHQMEHPKWAFVMTQPMEEVLAPVRAIRHATLTVTVVFLALFLIGMWALTKPTLRYIESCQRLAMDIQGGNLAIRLSVESEDEIGQLARSLNNMADQLLENRQELQAAEQKYRTIFENAVVGIFRVDMNGVVLAANDALARILGLQSSEEMIGQKVPQSYVDKEQRRFLYTALMSHGEVTAWEFDVARMDGTPALIQIHARAEKTPEGDIAAIQGVVEDITEQRKAEQAISRAKEMEQLLTEARLTALHHQMNPHFLFNVLNVIDVLARTAPERIPYLIQELARYLRYALIPRDGTATFLHQELEAIQSYLAIEKIRFEDNLLLEMDVEPSAEQAVIPDPLLQPLVENAIRHGMKTSDMPLRVCVRIAKKGDDLCIEIRNTGKWLVPTGKMPNTTGGVGLENLLRRLDLLFPKRHQVKTSEQDGWVTVRILLPFTEKIDSGFKWETNT